MRTTFARVAVAATLVSLTACGGATPGPQPSANDRRYYDQYVAVGDTYTAAPAVGTVSIDDVCVRSGINYPHLIARSLGSSLDDVSCTNAEVASLQDPQVVDQTTFPAQLDAVGPRTDLVTVGMGAAPAAIGAWFQTCPSLHDQDPTGSPCRDHFRHDDGDEVVTILRNGRKQLTASLKAIHKKAPEARVIVIGYPAIFPAKGDCPDAINLTPDDMRYAHSGLLYLNKTLKQAAAKGGAEFIDTYAATKGHDICAADPWIQGKKEELGVALSYSPHAEEQRAVADLVIRLLR